MKTKWSHFNILTTNNTKGSSFTLLQLLVVIAFLSTPTTMFAMETVSITEQSPQNTVQERLKEALEWEDWESRSYDLIDALEEHNDIIPTPQTQTVAFDILNQIYNQRTTYFQETLGQETDIEAFQLLLTTAAGNKFFSSQHQQQIQNFQRVAAIEQSLFDSKETRSYSNRLTKLSAIQRSAEGQNFESSTKTLYFEQITTAFNERGEKPKQDLDRLKNILKRGTSTTLLTPQQHEVVRGYLALFNLEDRIFAALNNPDYTQKLTGLNAVLQEAANKQLDTVTNTIITKALQDLVVQKPLDPTILANLNQVLQLAHNNQALSPTIKELIQTNLLPQVVQSQQTTGTQPATQIAQGQQIPAVMGGRGTAQGSQTAQAMQTTGAGKSQPALLLFEQELNRAMSNPTTLQKVDAVTLVMNKYFTIDIFPEAKNAFARALQTLFDQRYTPIKTQTIKTVQVPQKKRKKKKRKKRKKKTKRRTKKKKIKKKKK